ncbi:hypothetical protein BVRB_6g146090 isoform A [Beta vulgaris subsp. vulgaris]|nr:hypothetical protein BVRB_6g146090 isoform A [Beta vulgaris subsp. vulgaris]
MADILKTHNTNPQNPNPQTPPSHCDIFIPLQNPTSTFNFETAICSHGLFLMAPNEWDPHTKSLLRPLRLSLSSSAASTSALVRISAAQRAVLVRVYGVRHLAAEEEDAVVRQVKRMLRLSEREEKKVREFQELHSQAKEMKFGRVFRSPSLFEDMVKAILFCNCQWPRTLSMAKALCDLQLELQCHSSIESVNVLGVTTSEVATNKPESFTPGTPAVKESDRKRKMQEVVSRENAEVVDGCKADLNARMNSAVIVNGIQLKKKFTTFVSSISDENVNEPNASQCFNESSRAVSEERIIYSTQKMGNFPSPIEIASLDEKYLAKRCGLGYRGARILKLAQGVIEGRIQLDQLEELCLEASLSNYNKVDEKLKQIEGYGPFTRGNVLMCLGFYNVVPSDSETIRHLKQVHGKTTTIQKVQQVVEEMYRRYEPYQFLAYWWELWSFYEERFGKFSEMPSSDYKLVTASNMRTKKTNATVRFTSM